MPDFTLVVAPHAPLLRAEVAGAADPCARSRRVTIDVLARRAGALFVIVSPHAERAGVYSQAQGDLGLFGMPALAFSGKTSELAERVAGIWGRPLLDAPVDHGVLIPSSLAPPGSVFLCCGISEAVPLHERHREGIAIARAVHLAAVDEHEVVFIASAHSSAALSPGAPLTERPEGEVLDAALISVITDDPGALADPGSIADDLWAAGGSCGSGPFAALGEMARLTGLRKMEMLSHEAPVGVGYLVAEGKP